MTAPSSSARRRTSIRVRAALAGGLVFGVAAGLTSAAWTRSEYVTSTFTAGQMRLQLDVGAGYVQTDTVSTTVTGVFPGATGTVYQPVRIQSTSTSVAGAVVMNHAAFIGSGITSGLRYRVIRNAATCNAAAFTSAAAGDYLVGTATLTAAPQVTTAVATNLAVGSVSAKAASTLSLCFEFSLLAAAPASYMATSSAPPMTWTFTANST